MSEKIEDPDIMDLDLDEDCDDENSATPPEALNMANPQAIRNQLDFSSNIHTTPSR